LDELRVAHPNLLSPQKLCSREEVLRTPSVVPAAPGVYAWYFKRSPASVPTEGCLTIDDKVLLYVGISPKAPPANGRPASRQNLRTRLRYHMRGNAEGSTLRLTLGCLRSDELGLQLRRVGSGNRLTFCDGEERLSEWLAENALVTWEVTAEPWLLEHALISAVPLPLNFDQNASHAFCSTLAGIRRAARDGARVARMAPFTRLGSPPVGTAHCSGAIPAASGSIIVLGMPRTIDADLLAAALLGYESMLTEINSRIAELRQRLGTAPRAPTKHRISTAGRARIAAAQKKRWRR
jgi:hypothetical protein